MRWYLRYPLAYEHVAELLGERGLEVDASCIWRWVQAYAPEINKRCRPYLKPTNKSYRVDETYIKVKGKDRYLYRAVDSTGQTIDFLLTAKRDTAAAKRFLLKPIEATGNPMPRVINVDKNAAYPATIEAMTAEGTLPRRVRLRINKYLNNVIELRSQNREETHVARQGLRLIPRRVANVARHRSSSHDSKGGVRWLAKADSVGQARFLTKLFGIAA